jgi:hypothetical protein
VASSCHLSPSVLRSSPFGSSKPDSGFCSPVSSAAMVDLPPPDAPSSKSKPKNSQPPGTAATGIAALSICLHRKFTGFDISNSPAVIFDKN